MTPRVATSICFVVNGAMIGAWVAQIPFAQERLDVSNTTIGVVLLCMAAGAFVAMPLTGQVLDRHSSARVLRVTALLYPFSILLPLLAPGPVALAASLVVFGAVNGSMDVAMNGHGVAVERARGAPIMSSLHACWSLGGLAGAGCIAAAVALDADPRGGGAGVALALWALVLVATRHLGGASLHSEGSTRGFALPSRPVALMGGLCFLVMTAEGAVADWAGIYLRGDLGASSAASALGFAGFALGMATGRLTGDALVRRFSSGRVLVAGVLLAAGALGLLLVVGDAVVALVGFFAVGVGVANGVPLLFSAAGRVPPSGASLAAVFTIGYLGFILGPPLIGLLSDATSLPAALGVVCAGLGVVAALGGRAVGVDGSPAPEPRALVAQGHAERS